MDIIRNEGVPYYMTNKEWYYYDEEKGRDFLTDKATPKAIESYNEFYSEETLEDGI